MINSQEISQLKPVSAEFSDAVGVELSQASIPWREAYSNYQSGGWYVAQLLNSSGSTEQLRIDGGAPVPTPLLAQFPTIKQMLHETELDVRIARLARISPGSWMHEHNDEAGIGEVRQRLHIPLVSNPQAVLCFDGTHVHLAPGFMWKLDHERVPHAAANYGEADRVHLILDCRMNEALQHLIDGERISSDAVRALPVLDDQARQELVSRARNLIEDGDTHAGEALLLETFCRYDLQGRSCYDLLLAAYEGVEGAEDRARLWRERLKEVRGREYYR
jgi:hypothetical protein